MFVRNSALVALLGVICFFAACKKRSASGEMPSPKTINDSIETAPPILTPVMRNVNNTIKGYYQVLPALYAQTTKNYPLIIFIVGGGQTGNGASDLPLLLNDGMLQLARDKTFPPNFSVDGKNYSFLIFAPQFTQQPTAEELQYTIEFAKQNFRVDTTRIYLSGLSNGGVLSSELAALQPSKIAALVTMAGVFSDASLPQKCGRIAAINLPVWSFHNVDDFVIPSVYTVNFINALKSFRPSVTPRITIFNSATHDAWTPAINPNYRENNMNIYEFMLKYHR